MLSGKRVAILVEDEFEDLELTGPLETLRAAGAIVTIVGPLQGATYRGKRGEAIVVPPTSRPAPRGSRISTRSSFRAGTRPTRCGCATRWSI